MGVHTCEQNKESIYKHELDNTLISMILEEKKKQKNKYVKCFSLILELEFNNIITKKSKTNTNKNNNLKKTSA